jgi:predicted nucleic acid-binding protein
MDTSALAKPVVGENDSLSLRRREQAEVGEDLGRLASGYVAGEARGLDRLDAQAVSVD